MKERKNIRQRLWNKPQKFIEWLFSEKEWLSFDQNERLDEKISDQLLQNIKAQLKRDSSADKKEKRVGIYWPGIFSAAATLTLLLVAIGLWKVSEQDVPLTVKENPTLIQHVPQWKVYRNTSLKNIKLSLPDSSLVTLYPQSTLKHLAHFTDSSRETYLEGKAFFAVVKDKSRPFSVFAGGLKTIALGTSFTINTTVNGNKTIVKLHTGKVQVQMEHPMDNAMNKILLPGEAFTFNRITNKEVIKAGKPLRNDPESSFEIVDNTLQFKNIKLNEVLKILADAYQVKIEVGTAVGMEDITYTGDIDVNLERIDDVLQKICLLNDVEIQGSSKDGFIVQAK
ncbi:FecR family protein [Olivibacter domesticus]|uniref:FecR family protein n=1 Tax=Olivibacter domesticus TaxID=407022 RepID=A0A1H7Y799_OLID1|nr:FecR family protein [Olivibacter domesticus]SEM41805.1 FecR family protein [Olivibacter domesticus]